MKRQLRYRIQYVGGGWDLWVVFDSTNGSVASAHSTANWVARFRDDRDGLEAAKKRADALNDAPKEALNQ